MTIQPIRYYGDPVLRSPADPVVTFDKELRVLVKDLVETMQKAGGVGLAAPQIGVGLRVFAFHVDEIVGHLVNPVLEFPDDEEQDGDLDQMVALHEALTRHPQIADPGEAFTVYA